ncbi:MAG: hypothetical protein WKF66_12715 [Pedobacter sp.]
MVKKFFSTMTQAQFFVFVMLLLLSILFSVSTLPKWYNSATAVEYEPWNPDNINNIKEKITSTNNEASKLEKDISYLSRFKDKLNVSLRTFDSMNLDSPYAQTLKSFAPRLIFSANQDYDESIGDYEVNESIAGKIENAAQAYSTDLSSLCNTLKTKDYTSPFGFARNDSLFTKETPPKFTIAKEIFTQKKGSMVFTLKELKVSLQLENDTLIARKKNLIRKLDDLRDEFNKKNFNINQYAVVIGIPFFIIAALIMYWYGLKSTRENANTLTPAIDPKDKFAFAINTITVLLLILSLLILGLSKVIAENTLAALLGTIGGYVLNNKNKDSLSQSPAPLAPAPITTLGGVSASSPPPLPPAVPNP